MKNSKILYILIVTLALSGLLSSCANNKNTAPGKETESPAPAMASAEKSPEGALPSQETLSQVTLSPVTLSPVTLSPTPTTPSSSPVPSPSVSPTPSPSPSAASADGFTFEEKTYTEDTVSIKYPQITGMSDADTQEKLNQIISDTALRDVRDLISGTTYELSYKVTLNTPTVISMYFDGYVNVPETIHPNQFLRGLTIDVAKQEIITPGSLLYAIDGVVDIMLSGTYSSMGYDMTSEYEASIKENLTSLGEDFWINELKNADALFLTPDALVISVSVPHVMGDHVEIYHQFKDLVGYQTDYYIWLNIAK
jgi:hypothetical protein